MDYERLRGEFVEEYDRWLNGEDDKARETAIVCLIVNLSDQVSVLNRTLEGLYGRIRLNGPAA